MNKVLQLKGVSYEWKTEMLNERGFRGGRQAGLIAQQVEKVFPELAGTDSKGYKAVIYDKLGPVLIEAVKEQQKEIEEKDARIEKLEDEIENQRKSLATLQEAISSMMARLAILKKPAKKVALK